MTSLRGPWAGARRVLAVRLDALGDVLMTTPALRALAEARPSIDLTLLTSPAGAAVARLIPEVTSVLVAEPSWMKPARPDDDAGAADRRLVEQLRDGCFDGAVIFTVSTQSALPAALSCRLAGIPLRLAHSRENPYRLLTDWVPEPEPDTPLRHEVRRQLDLVATIGARIDDEHLSVRVPAGAARRIRALLTSQGIRRGRPWAVIHPGATAPSRRWPADRFAAVARTLATEHGWLIVATGQGQDAAQAREVVAGLGDRGVSLAGSLDIGELAALIAAAPVLIANNSGPSHLAAAVGTPVVDVYAMTNLQHAPWHVPARVIAHDVPCRNCRKSECPFGHHACLRGIDPEAVATAALALAAGDRRRLALPAGIIDPWPGVIGTAGDMHP
jgi:lipopolysaccharide heptosyltransferase II